MATDLGLAVRPGSERAPRGLRAASSGSLGRLLLTYAVLAWFAILILIPGLALVRQVLLGGLKPFLSALARPEVQRAFGMSLGITALATVVNTVFGIGLALVLTRQRFWGRALADGLVDLPFAISPVVAGLMLIVLYGPDGWLGRWFEPHGWRVVYAVPGMILATLFVTVPFVVRELVPVLRELGEEYEQAAYTLGAGRWRTFWSVTLPSIRWGVAYGVTLTIARSLGEFGAVLVVSGNVIGHTQTATLYIQEGVESFHPAGAYAASLVLAAISFVLLVGMEFVAQTPRKHQGVSSMSMVSRPSPGLSRRSPPAASSITDSLHFPSATRPAPARKESSVGIEVKNLSKCYGSFQAVKDVSFEVRAGQLVALLGPSGSGKSTILRIIAGLEPADAGGVVLTGEDATLLPVQERGVGFVFQHYALFRHMTVRENIAFGLKVRKLPRAEIKTRVNELLELVQLGGYAGRYPSQLSGGQRQRVALARCSRPGQKCCCWTNPLAPSTPRFATSCAPG